MLLYHIINMQHQIKPFKDIPNDALGFYLPGKLFNNAYDSTCICVCLVKFCLGKFKADAKW